MVEKSIKMTSHSSNDHNLDDEIQFEKHEMVKNGGDFEFLSSFDSSHSTMLTADELFFEGKLLPYSQSQINLKSSDQSDHDHDHDNQNGILFGREIQEPRIWFVDDDPSPRPPKCTVLFKELLRLNKQRSSVSSSSSSSSSRMEEKEKEKEKEKHVIIKRIKKGLERTKSANIRIRPMFNVPISTLNGKSSSLPPLFPPTQKKP